MFNNKSIIFIGCLDLLHVYVYPKLYNFFYVLIDAENEEDKLDDSMEVQNDSTSST